VAALQEFLPEKMDLPNGRTQQTKKSTSVAMAFTCLEQSLMLITEIDMKMGLNNGRQR